jgi:hypothetical protein
MSYNRTVANALEQLGHNPNKHLPIDGIPIKQIELVNWRGDPWLTGVSVFVMSQRLAQMRGIKQRTRCKCPADSCGREFALGNLHQHWKVHSK